MPEVRKGIFCYKQYGKHCAGDWIFNNRYDIEKAVVLDNFYNHYLDYPIFNFLVFFYHLRDLSFRSFFSFFSLLMAR